MTFYRIIFIIIFSGVFMQCNSKGIQKEISDSDRFAIEYPLIGSDNIFIYKNADEAADILENGRGIVFFGFNECSWCQYYAVFLHDIVREMEIDKIYYCDIKEDRDNYSESYQRIVNILSGHLQYDDEGRQRIFVPDVCVVSRGRIILHDFETSMDTLGINTPQEYWNDERVNSLKERLRGGINILNQLISRSCNVC